MSLLARTGVIKWVFALQKVTNPNFLKIGNHFIFSGQFWDLTVEARSPTAPITGYSGQTALLSLLLHIFNPIVWLHTHTELEMLEYLQIWSRVVNGLLLLVTWPSTRLWLAVVADHSISTAMLWLWWIRTGMYHQVLTLTQRGNTIIHAQGKFIPGIIVKDEGWSLHCIPPFFFCQWVQTKHLGIFEDDQ